LSPGKYDVNRVKAVNQLMERDFFEVTLATKGLISNSLHSDAENK